MDNLFYKFYNKTINERREILKSLNLLSEIKVLENETANLMIENYIQNYQIPLGIAMNFEINNEKILIPMAIEEPSVVAAASNGAKILGNIKTEMIEKAVIGQIVLYDVKNVKLSLERLKQHQQEFIEMAKEKSQNMIKRGGGPKKIWFEGFESEKFVTLYLSVDTCDAMGANTINTILEHISQRVCEIAGADYILRIISNNATESIVSAKASIPILRLNKDVEVAKVIAKKIELATKYASLDPYRASTHNKGIMNGVDAVVLATGNDWRAVEAAAHTYAARSGQYKSLTSWIYDEDKEELIGEIEMPLPVATLGGTISIHQIANWSLNLMNNPSSKKLASIIAAVGLAQNFSAVKAIVTEGIQKGHMSLHAKTLAKQAGANENEIDEVVKKLKSKGKINIEEAKLILDNLRNK
ncbi:hydroxymethylglutaryl-CoA reductase, degradative [Helcococcus ovis]|uniref:hydroxymethylglutaryl-CoA reductase, degradative n=1 Tax=Helcococcus ovis TaxID=72026 RepID=UPI00106FFAF6|nr:hydroxymethylglutaryl-CoA reductase, degradative [Helcococcus ovis]TFF68756.1 hydroxymethylglutaryl-CoA reductase, degradative [Helcococcus ovis]WNZ01227.1 hydroxymethylglutaryl-CoA reductase, degradative [Helcococcus ovis]